MIYYGDLSREEKRKAWDTLPFVSVTSVGKTRWVWFASKQPVTTVTMLADFMAYAATTDASAGYAPTKDEALVLAVTFLGTEECLVCPATFAKGWHQSRKG